MAPQKIELEIPECPDVAPWTPNVNGIPSWVVGWGYVVGTVLIIALLAAIAFTVAEVLSHRRQRRQGDQSHAERLAELHKTCDFCGGEYDPLPKKSKKS